MLNLLCLLYQVHHQRLDHGDLTKLNAYAVLGETRVTTLKIQQIGLILILVESSDYSAQTGKAR